MSFGIIKKIRRATHLDHDLCPSPNITRSLSQMAHTKQISSQEMCVKESGSRRRNDSNTITAAYEFDSGLESTPPIPLPKARSSMDKPSSPISSVKSMDLITSIGGRTKKLSHSFGRKSSSLNSVPSLNEPSVSRPSTVNSMNSLESEGRTLSNSPHHHHLRGQRHLKFKEPVDTASLYSNASEESGVERNYAINISHHLDI